uniref:EF-hand domain-containing protein n=1 Tax=Hemiselmis andersenii TaxID=464988 RepID=A0A6T8P8Y1_HEMAN|mmetsp:Transcript_35627/g.83450  ORF Transcript_35627/g.83450 Transcript_35627/m.83450 type:complete len:191 (+) Transcript_35627:196-768(+)|eukprot:CAMPEP_0114128640 /NCGR_PEP_ID=MMETSP0043_2-20121206/11042_1 /TAXON_ID=464988 /ORGANISM="Hemiselmis andersenii, Strain CCMP644" /LENGTH=190 /DNA_ID=CAMNT_0001221847 /DNA_START=171 /DNA_END=743 /DNA_ORIENTATION=-
MNHDDDHDGMDGGKDEWEVLGLEKRIDLENLKRVFERLDLNKDGKIDVEELQAMYEDLGYKPRKQTEYGVSEVEDVIWEVDEDANGYIDWDNFVQLYMRCRKDKSGKEPTRLYNLIEFMVCDKDGGGTMSEDECMEILFHRFGKEQMKEMTDKLFKHNSDEAEKEFSYTEFLQLVDDKNGILGQAAKKGR